MLSKKQQKIIDNNDDKVVVIACPAAGKALTNDSLVYNEEGSRKISSLVPGEKIYGSDGELHTVTGVFPQGKKLKHIIEFSDGTKSECCEEHLWTVKSTQEKDNWQTLTTKDIMGRLDECLEIPMTAPVSFKNRITPHNPYLFGYRLKDNDVPNNYKYNTPAVRMELLRGIFDKNGTYEDGIYSIKLKNENTINDVKEICESLGLTAEKQSKDEDFFLVIGVSNAIPTLHCLLKPLNMENTFKAHRHIVKIIKTEEMVEMTCIQIDSEDSLFLTNNFIVTHNTRLLTEKLEKEIKERKDNENVVAITFTKAAAAEMRGRVEKDLGKTLSSNVFIGTIHAYANLLLRAASIDTKNALEEEDFDKLFEMVKSNTNCIQEVSCLLLDEAQDTSTQQYEFLFDLVNPKRFFVVGDFRQCQPTGTKITLKNGDVINIEDVKEGDFVEGLHKDETYFEKPISTFSRVNKVSKRIMVNTPLIEVKTENHLSKYTPKHKTFVKINNDKLFHLFILVSDNGEYMVIYGKCDEVLSRFIAEKSKWKNIWIFKEFEFSAHYDASLYTQYIEEELSYDNTSIADLSEPLLSKYEPEAYSTYPIIETAAVNLITNSMSCLVLNKSTEKIEFEKIESVVENLPKEEFFPVYSLETEIGSYIGDNIFTHNCIYSFRDASPEELFKLSKSRGVVSYDLDENYRNGTTILNFSKNIINKLGVDYWDQSIPKRGVSGRVIQLNDLIMEDIINEIQKKKDYKDWFILTRTNKELNDFKSELESKKVPLVTFRQGDLSNTELKEKMESNKVKLLTIHSSKGLENKKVVVYGARFFNDEERRIAYVAATRAEDELYWIPYKRRTKTKAKKINWEVW